VVFMIYVTATAFSLRSKVILKTGEMEKPGMPEIILSDSARELDHGR